jgi:hypothetical protein
LAETQRITLDARTADALCGEHSGEVLTFIVVIAVVHVGKAA